jgi:hypothetical protein
MEAIKKTPSKKPAQSKNNAPPKKQSKSSPKKK